MKHRIIRTPDGSIDTWETTVQAGREYAARAIHVEGAANLVISYQRAVSEAPAARASRSDRDHPVMRKDGR